MIRGVGLETEQPALVHLVYQVCSIGAETICIQ